MTQGLAHAQEDLLAGINKLLDRFEVMQYGSKDEKAAWNEYAELRYTLYQYKMFIEDDIGESQLEAQLSVRR